MIKKLNKGLALLLATVLALSLSGALITAFALPAEDGGYEYTMDEGSDGVGDVSIVESQYNLIVPFNSPPPPFVITGDPGDPQHTPYFRTLYFYCTHFNCCCPHVFRARMHGQGASARVTIYIVSEHTNPPQLHAEYVIVDRINPPDGIYWPLLGGGANRPPEHEGTPIQFTHNGKLYTIVFHHQGNTLIGSSHLSTRCNPKDLTVVKEWDDNENEEGVRPAHIYVQLFRNGEPYVAHARYGEPVRVYGGIENWYRVFTGLNRRCPEGYLIAYSVEEVNVHPRYEVYDISDIVDGVITITNILIYEPLLDRTPLDKRVVKVWDDSNNVEGLRPGRVEVRLLKNEEVYRTVFLSEANNWSHDFPNLFVYDEDGIDYDFEIIEIVPYRYDDCIVLNVNTGVWTITNTLIPEQTIIRDPDTRQEDPDTRQHGRQQQDGRAPLTGDLATAIPLLASILLSVSAVLGGTSLRNRFRK